MPDDVIYPRLLFKYSVPAGCLLRSYIAYINQLRDCKVRVSSHESILERNISPKETISMKAFIPHSSRNPSTVLKKHRMEQGRYHQMYQKPFLNKTKRH